ncbi:F-box/LRR-repeat protein 17-like [Aristolochia californica]|uniref:F-box/LRR-repeat protein 17-like n=1 Tax=Aristolochia californica TaxID=171875 RepID=UPI0035E0E1BA
MQQRQLSPETDAASLKHGKKRGNYNCGRCGLPKKGHSCNITVDPTNPVPLPTRLRQTQLDYYQSSPSGQHHLLRRALSFDDDEVVDHVEPVSDDEESDACEPLPWSCLVEVLRRAGPKSLLSAAQVCRGWRDCARRLWRSTEELRLRVPPRSRLGSVGSLLQKCTGLLSLTLRMESDLDATLLACIAFSCPNLESLEIRTAENAVNWISGDELGRFVAEKRCLSTLKIEGCTNLGFLNICSSSLSTLWLSDLQSISRTAINCPKLKELSLEFSCLENDSTDLVMMVNSFGRTCPRLRNMHIASVRLSHDVVLSLAQTNLRDLRMLSLVLGTEITDASVAAIASSYTNLELLDLSGSSVSDSGIGMICNVFPQTLSRLSLAHCPNITSSGIQFATAQLPYLQLIDCGMTISDPSGEDLTTEQDSCSSEPSYEERVPKVKHHPMYQKLIIKHGRLRKLSLWGCSGLDALCLNCPELNDLNLNSCTNLHPARLLLQCPSLENVYAVGCGDVLIGAIHNQIVNDFISEMGHFPCKRLADGSKRVLVPCFPSQQPSDDEKGKALQSRCNIHVN